MRLPSEVKNIGKCKGMSIIEAYNEAWENGDVEALSELIHDDCVFDPHVGGFTMSKSDILGFVGSENTPKSEKNRILFENDEVGVAQLETTRLRDWRPC